MKKKENKFLIEKAIYAKRKNFTKQQLIDVLNEEIKHHLLKYPELAFVEVGNSRVDSFKTHIYPIKFIYKSLVVPKGKQAEPVPNV